MQYKYRGLWSPHIKVLMEIILEEDSHDMLVRVCVCVCVRARACVRVSYPIIQYPIIKHPIIQYPINAPHHPHHPITPSPHHPIPIFTYSHAI
jgi:hypothetical protein